MGYTPRYLNVWTKGWLDEGWLPRDGRIAELGAQTLEGNPVTVRRSLIEFLVGIGMPKDDVRRFVTSLDLPCTTAPVYRYAGFEYASLDVNDLDGSTFFDLNTEQVPEAQRNYFDIVNNEGTIEHLGNPMNGFKVAHDLVKPGGVIRHSVPLSGYFDHGFFNMTPKLFYSIILANDYEILYFTPEISHIKRRKGAIAYYLERAQIRCRKAPDADFGLRSSSPDLRASNFPEVGLWSHIAYRKVRDQPFSLPVDHLETDKDFRIRDRLKRNYAEFMRRAEPACFTK